MSDVSVDIIKNRSGEAPDLPSGANLSGVSTAATLQVTNLNPTHINASGVTTATTFSGSLKSTGTPTLGLGVTINSSGINISGVATAGIVSATTLYGDGSNLTGVAMSIAPISYNPDVNDTQVTLASGIGITFTERIKAGTGNITLRLVSAGGTVVENFGVGSSVTINNNEISIDPTADLSADTVYHLSYPSGSFTNTGGDVSYVGTAYTFAAKPLFSHLFVGGRNQYGSLGLNQSEAELYGYSSPVQLGSDTTWNFVAQGTGFTPVASIKSDGTLWTWGWNYNGALGLNQAHSISVSSPTQIPGTNWSAVTSGQYGATATKTDGTLWVWGSDGGARLGTNSRDQHRSSPVQLPGTDWGTGGDKSSCNHNGAHVIKTNGTLWCWGENGYGTLGQNNGTYYSSPVQIPGTTWSKISGATQHSLGLKTDGTLWAWGRNSFGQLAQNNVTSYSSPRQIPGTTWSIIHCNNNFSYGIKTDGTLWGWGENRKGQLAQNNVTEYSSPIQIPGTTWASVRGGDYSTGATKTDGTFWRWGYGNWGNLGQNNTVQYSSPVQIPGTTWSTDQYHIGGVAYGYQAIKDA